MAKRVAAACAAYVTLDDPTLRALAREDPALFLQRLEPPLLWVRVFSGLDRFAEDRGEGGVVCLCPHTLPLAEKAAAIPVGLM